MVGAGPGDPGLITLKGMKVLQQADVVLYDALANPALLEYVRPSAQKIFVGKRSGTHSLSQEEINTLITGLAFKYGHVVRLKGGDPFMFGRGMEEIEVARSLGIEVDYVPGVSSAIAVPGLAGIPLTHRGLSRSVWIVSGTSFTGNLTDDLRHAARSEATVVVLMGTAALEEIVGLFREEGRPDDLVAVIRNGSLEDQQVVSGTLSNIVSVVAGANVGPPAIIVIGEVVKFLVANKESLEDSGKSRI